MLNEKNERELCYVVRIDNIVPIEGSDHCECAVVGGWNIMVRKDTFHINDVAIYFEIDSKLDPTNPAFDFMGKYNHKVKTQRYTFGGKGRFFSQGLLLSAQDLGWTVKSNQGVAYIEDNEGNSHYPDDKKTCFLTKQLKVIYYEAEDNTRKANGIDKYQKMGQRHKFLLKKAPFSWLMKKEWGRKLLFLFFGKKKDKAGDWPSHICAKTDVERIQNMPQILSDKSPYVATEKVDGSSFTVAAEKLPFGRIKYYICSRNVVFKDENQDCFYPSNVYFEMYNKYDLKDKITRILNDYKLNNVAIQMEIYGKGIQKRDYSTEEHKVAVFHIVTDKVKMPMDKVIEITNKYKLPHVPIIDCHFIFPDTMEALQTYVESSPSMIDGLPREGIVFYDKATGQRYTKFVSPEFLMKYHS